MTYVLRKCLASQGQKSVNLNLAVDNKYFYGLTKKSLIWPPTDRWYKRPLYIFQNIKHINSFNFQNNPADTVFFWKHFLDFSFNPQNTREKCLLPTAETVLDGTWGDMKRSPSWNKAGLGDFYKFPSWRVLEAPLRGRSGRPRCMTWWSQRDRAA